MNVENELIWNLSTQGTLTQLGRFIKSGTLEPVCQSSVADPLAIGLLPDKTLRSKDGLIEVWVLHASGSPGELVSAVRDHWSTLRDRGLAESQPVKIFVTADNPRIVVYMFRWKTAESRSFAQMDTAMVQALARINSNASVRDWFPLMNEVYQGFEYRHFPLRGGVELLRGKCTCTVALHGFEGEVELDGQNGFVLMHRGPVFTQDDPKRLKSKRLMPVTLVAHGADTPNPFSVPGERMPVDTPQTRVRVEQNTELPQFGIILADQEGADFPATAMWIVHWRIHTPIGTIITDPNVPLVFGPTTVNHYPPVGTEFKSSTGPVDVYHVESGKVVGTLHPGELTAFDIVVTMDDEIPSIMDVPARYHVEMFNKVVNDPEREISVNGLIDDYRVPRNLRSTDKE